MTTETKTLTFQVKDLGTTTDASGQEFGHIEAYGAMFNNVDEGNDRIIPGAFKRTLTNSKERAASRQKKYIVPMLWQHDVKEMIGGWYDIDEDTTGLRAKGDIALATQRGREYYALAKAGMSDQFSIIYDIPAGGAKYDKSGVRDLTDMRLFSIDPVTFAMNDDTFTVAVKAAGDSATVVGNVKGPIGARDEAWDGAKAEGEIWAVAYNDDAGTVDKTLASKYFMVRSGDGTKKGDYSLPFWNVGSSPHINVGAVKAIAGAVQGSRGATTDYPDGVKTKVESLYRRINAKYPDDPQLTPPWKSDKDDDKKGRFMPTNKAAHERQRKTFQDHYNEEQCKDLLRDWQDVVLCAFTGAVYDAFSIGDEPEADVNDALDALKTAVAEWVEEAVKYGLSDYIESQSDTYSGGTEYRMQNGTTSGYGYGYFSRQTPMHQKAMTESDATTGGFTSDHVDKLHGAATKAKDAVDRHVGTLADAAEEVKSLISQASKAAKAGRTLSAANEQTLSDHADMLDAAAKSLKKSVNRQMGTVNSVADDLATVLQGSEDAYGTDPGTPQAGQQEGKNNRAPSDSRTRAPHTAPSDDDTPSEDEVTAALAALKQLRTA